MKIALIREALQQKMPVFGICRGHQLLNAAMGGGLHTDIPTQIGKKVTTACPTTKKRDARSKWIPAPCFSNSAASQ